MRLQSPFPASDYEWRVQSETRNGDKVQVLCYVQARAIQNRLDEVVGPWGWQTEFVKGPDGGVICRLSLRDPDSGEWVTKEDGAENTQVEAVKGGLSSALKRVGSAWGIGRLLYNLPSAWVPLEPRGTHFHKAKNGANKDKYLYWNPPPLPAWAIPHGDKSEPPAPEPPQQVTEDPADALINLIVTRRVAAGLHLPRKDHLAFAGAVLKAVCPNHPDKVSWAPEELRLAYVALAAGKFNWQTGERIPDAA